MSDLKSYPLNPLGTLHPAWFIVEVSLHSIESTVNDSVQRRSLNAGES
jgi:hypothetical protein